jgi:cell fate (sporulation/competence/biofilm development) regulator YlbF (YheA/YmcA/DUF963 family)
MPADVNEILSAAEKLGQLVAQHPAIEKYKSAQKLMSEDAEATSLMRDLERLIENLSRQEQSGISVTDAQKMQLDGLQGRIASNIKVKNLHMAQMEFVDLLRKVSQAWQKPLADGTGGAVAGPRLAGM